MRLGSKLKQLFQPKGTAGPLAQKMRDEGLTYLSERKMVRLERGLAEVQDNGVPGDFVEFGVALGGSAIVMAQAARDQGRRFAGFDVFSMIPPPTSEKDDAKSKERYEIIAAGKSEGIDGAEYYGYTENLYAKVCDSFARHGLPVDGDRTRLIEGLFEDTVPGAGLDQIAFCHVDCDWYDPVRYCLQSIADILPPGGIVLLDDYHDYGGCQRAVDEFLAARKDFKFEDGRNVILRKRG